jgi:hypothetical protein
MTTPQRKTLPDEQTLNEIFVREALDHFNEKTHMATLLHEKQMTENELDVTIRNGFQTSYAKTLTVAGRVTTNMLLPVVLKKIWEAST